MSSSKTFQGKIETTKEGKDLKGSENSAAIAEQAKVSFLVDVQVK